MGKKPGRACGPCGDKRRNELDRRLLEMDLTGETYRLLSSEFDHHEAALRRHKNKHLIAELAAVKAAREAAKAQALQEVHAQELEVVKAEIGQGIAVRLDNAAGYLDELKHAREKALLLLDSAEEAADTRVFGPPSNYLREIRELIKLMAELEGKLAAQPQVNILVTPQWIELRTLIVKALEPYPEAKAVVVNALEE